MLTPIPTPLASPVPGPTETAALNAARAVRDATVEKIQDSWFFELVLDRFGQLAGGIMASGVPAPWPTIISAGLSILALLVIGIGVFRLMDLLIPILLRRIVGHWSEDWARVLEEERVLHRLAHLAPLAVLAASLPVVAVFGFAGPLLIAIELYAIWIFLALILAMVGLILGLLQLRPEMSSLPVNTIEQAIKLFVTIIGVLLALSVTFDRSPIFFLSGIGAATAVIILVFRDTLLGLVAGIILALNDMVRVGDWIEIPGTAVNGDVTEMTLTTVRVQNFDRTTVLVPAYDLISKSVINWRGMVDSGGRRIKRPIHIDMNTIHYVDRELLEKFRRFDLLGDYLDAKISEIDAWNESHPAQKAEEINTRRQTNVGVYRAYIVAYLRAHPKVHSAGFTFLVRQLEPTAAGLPIEVYVFTNDNRWAEYEDIQADIFDHLLAAAPEFGLRIFQSPSGTDLRELKQA
ncbi:MAG: mechanosensitive ion channel family protein [Deltaproteobacteria bacterium]